MVLVMDSSGSMAGPAGGGTKIAAAKTALNSVIDGLPTDARVGLRVYGSRVYSRTDPGACTDSVRVVDVGTANRGQLRAAVQQYEPYGETPIGYALQQAAQDLPDSGERSIVLVSDGEATCAPDPCRVAAKLHAADIDVRIDVVGLAVSGAARRSLSCVARAGGGSYVDAGSADQLTDALDRLSTRALRPYSTTGKTVVGTTETDDAPTIAAGDWTDRIGPGAVRHYLVDRRSASSTISAAATIAAPMRTDGYLLDNYLLQVGLTTRSGEHCGSDFTVAQQSSPTLATATATSDADCRAQKQLVLTIKRVDKVRRTSTLELRVSEERSVRNAASLPEPAATPTWQDLAGTPTTQVVGGTSFARATALTPGSASGTLVPGEVQVFAVPVGWGQRLEASLSIAAPAGSLGEAVGLHGLPVSIDLFSPQRREAAWGLGPTRQSVLMDGVGADLAATTYAVRYRNRTVTDGQQAADSVAGRYYVVVALGRRAKDASFEVPFTLRTAVTGEVSGAPVYVTDHRGMSSATGRTEETTGATTGQRWWWSLAAAAVMVAAGAAVRRRVRSRQ